MLEATVDEVAGTGVDAHLLQPGLGVVPMWKSKVQPLEEHAAWLKETYGQKLDQYTQAVVNGTDLIQVFLDRCRMRGQAPFISIRMNDAHHKENVDKKKGEKGVGSVSMSINKFYYDHPQYRLVPGSLSGKDLVLNWAEPEVRAQKFALLQELCENYDIEGLELDFLRTYSYFRLNETTREQRAGIITAFVKDVRALLNRTAPTGTRRPLSVRVPCYVAAFDPLGIDLNAMTSAGVDMVNASSHYFTTQQHDLAEIRKQTGPHTLYFELCHTIWKGEKVAVGYDVFPYRRATREHLHTAAHLAYARGADGISLFNFAYYRENGTGEGRGVFGEPPFDALKALRDPRALAAGAAALVHRAGLARSGSEAVARAAQDRAGHACKVQLQPRRPRRWLETRGATPHSVRQIARRRAVVRHLQWSDHHSNLGCLRAFPCALSLHDGQAGGTACVDRARQIVGRGHQSSRTHPATRR